MVAIHILAFFVGFFVSLFLIVVGVRLFGAWQRRTREALPARRKGNRVALHSPD